MRGWPGFAGMEPEAAAGARVGAGLALRLANKLAATLALLHGSLRVQRTHARGHLVTGASPATSPCGGASRLRRKQWLELEIELGVRGKRSRDSRGSCREGQRARGRAGVAEFDGERRRGRSSEMMTMAAARGPSGHVAR